jgi:hypothetical protein
MRGPRRVPLRAVNRNFSNSKSLVSVTTVALCGREPPAYAWRELVGIVDGCRFRSGSGAQSLGQRDAAVNDGRWTLGSVS